MNVTIYCDDKALEHLIVVLPKDTLVCEYMVNAEIKSIEDLTMPATSVAVAVTGEEYYFYCKGWTKFRLTHFPGEAWFNRLICLGDLDEGCIVLRGTKHALLYPEVEHNSNFTFQMVYRHTKQIDIWNEDCHLRIEGETAKWFMEKPQPMFFDPVGMTLHTPAGATVIYCPDLFLEFT